MTLSELWDETEPRPYWQCALDVLPADRLERAAALVASVYVFVTVVLLVWTVRP